MRPTGCRKRDQDAGDGSAQLHTLLQLQSPGAPLGISASSGNSTGPVDDQPRKPRKALCVPDLNLDKNAVESCENTHSAGVLTPSYMVQRAGVWSKKNQHGRSSVTVEFTDHRGHLPKNAGSRATLSRLHGSPAPHALLFKALSSLAAVRAARGRSFV